MFKWTCLIVASLFGIVILYVIVDLRRSVTQSIASAEQAVGQANNALATVNAELPTIVGEVKKGTTALSGLAEDVKLLKSVVGIEKNQRGLRGLATYADELQQTLAESFRDEKISMQIEAVFGKSLKVVETGEEFLVGLNKEMMIILALSKSKQEVLWRATHTGPPRRTPYWVQVGDDEPVRLDALLRQQHAESANLPEFTP